MRVEGSGEGEGAVGEGRAGEGKGEGEGEGEGLREGGGKEESWPMRRRDKEDEKCCGGVKRKFLLNAVGLFCVVVFGLFCFGKLCPQDIHHYHIKHFDGGGDGLVWFGMLRDLFFFCLVCVCKQGGEGKGWREDFIFDFCWVLEVEEERKVIFLFRSSTWIRR